MAVFKISGTVTIPENKIDLLVDSVLEFIEDFGGDANLIFRSQFDRKAAKMKMYEILEDGQKQNEKVD